MSKIHVTGATGYVGASLVKYLKANGHVVEKATYRLPDVPEKSIAADIVIHLAVAGGGTAHKPRKGADDPDMTKRVNIEGTKALLSGIKNKNTRIILMSTTAVYGKFDDARMVNEESELKPTSVYGQNKVDTEKIIKNSGFDWMILRPCGIFGPSVDHRFGNSFLNVVVDNAIKNHEIRMMGGDQLIDTLYLTDLIDIVIRSCSVKWYSGEIFNVAGEIVKVEEMLKILHQTLLKAGIKIRIKKLDFEGKPVALTDSQKIRRAFPGWTNTSLECSFHSFVSAYIRQIIN
jgi:nucleoside-diphosphate-sugar epimerase